MIFTLIYKQKKRSSLLGERFLPWSPKKGQRIGVPNFCQFFNRCNWNKTFLNQAANFSKSSVTHSKIFCGPLVEKPWSRVKKMKRKHTNNKLCQFTVISIGTTATRTKFWSSSLICYIYQYKSLRIVNTQVVGPILTKTFETRRFVSRKVGQTDDRSQIAVTNLPHSVVILKIASQQYEG